MAPIKIGAIFFIAFKYLLVFKVRENQLKINDQKISFLTKRHLYR